MARLKYLLFALPLLALWILQLTWISPGFAEQAGAAVGARADAAARAIAAQLTERTLQLQPLAVRQAASPSAWAALQKGRGDEVTSERWSALRDAVIANLPRAMRSTARIGLVGSGTPLIGGATGEGAPPPKGVTLPAADGLPVVQSLSGTHYVLVGFPLAGMQVVLGAPLLDPAFLDAQADIFKLEAAGLLDGTQLVGAAGPNKDPAGLAIKAQAGRAQAIHSGALDTFGPIALPFLTSPGDSSGGGAGLFWASRQPVAGTSLEAVAVVSAKELMGVLAGHQRSTLVFFTVLLAWTVGWIALAGYKRGGGEAKINFGGLQQPEDTVQFPNAGANSFISRVEPPVSALAEPPGVAGPRSAAIDDFRTGESFVGTSSPPPVEVFPFPAPGSEPPPTPLAEVTASAEPGSDGAGFAAMSEEEDTSTTRAYPTAGLPPADIFNSAPEATRVAAIPQELLDQARLSNEVAPSEVTRVNGVTATGPQGDEAHFQDVYRDFVATREQCGEAPEALTYDKFVGKLRKNRDQLVQKYACRTVRFQVYVKDGKAALKATPVKD